MAYGACSKCGSAYNECTCDRRWIRNKEGMLTPEDLLKLAQALTNDQYQAFFRACPSSIYVEVRTTRFYSDPETKEPQRSAALVFEDMVIFKDGEWPTRATPWAHVLKKILDETAHLVSHV